MICCIPLKLAVLLSSAVLLLTQLTAGASFGISNEMLVVPKSEKPAEINGNWSTKTEWTDASEIKVQNEELTAYIRAKHDGTYLYLLVDFISDHGLDVSGDFTIICFDTNNDRGNTPQSDDYCFYRVTRTGDATDGILQGNGIGWTVLQEADTWDPYDEKFDAAVSYSHLNDPYDSLNNHVIYEFRIPIDFYSLKETMSFYVYANDAYIGKFVEWPTNAGGKQYKLIVKDVLPSPDKWAALQVKINAEDTDGKRPESPIAVTTDKTDYYTGDLVKIEGHVPAITDGNEVNIIVKDANGETFTKLRTKPADNQFIATFQLPPYSKLFPLGKWTIEVSYAIWVTKVDISILGERIPWYAVTVSEPWFVILSSSTGPSVGHDISIATEIKNDEQKDQQLTYIVQIKDERSTTVFLKWLTEILPAKDSARFSIIWVPELAGEYVFEIFAWNDINDPIPLSPVQSYSLAVE